MMVLESMDQLYSVSVLVSINFNLLVVAMNAVVVGCFVSVVVCCLSVSIGVGYCCIV